MTAGPGTASPGVTERRIAEPTRGGTRLTGSGAVRRVTWLGPAAWASATVILFLCYLRLSGTLPIESDGGADALQAWAMLHGNVLLHGWHLSNLSFYTLDLPEYMLIELGHGLSAQDIHIGAAATYTTLLLLVAWLARGSTTGRPAAVRMLIASGIMIAPELGDGVTTLLSSPDHIGSAALVLVTWLLLDRAPRRWYLLPAVTLLLVSGLVSDNTVLLTGVVPLALVCAVRVYLARIVNGQPLGSVRFEVGIGAAALLAVPLARGVLVLISVLGGFGLSATGLTLVPFSEWLTHGMDALHGLLVLFGADFTGRDLGVGSALIILHLVGLGLAGWAVARALRRIREIDLTAALLAAGVLVNLAGYLFGWRQAPREMVAVLPLTAVLAGRLLGARLDRARLVPALAFVLVGYLASLGVAMAQPPAPDPSQQLANWLAGHHLRSGLAGYWQANSVTLASGGHVSVRAVSGDPVGAGGWETNKTWYDPSRYRADFVVLAPTRQGLTEPPVVATFGRPAHVYHDGAYTVLVWNKNLLNELRH